MTFTPEMTSTIASQGIFAILFVALLVYSLRKNEARENKLMDCLEKYAVLYDELRHEVCNIKEIVKEGFKK